MSAKEISLKQIFKEAWAIGKNQKAPYFWAFNGVVLVGFISNIIISGEGILAKLINSAISNGFIYSFSAGITKMAIDSYKGKKPGEHSFKSLSRSIYLNSFLLGLIIGLGSETAYIISEQVAGEKSLTFAFLRVGIWILEPMLLGFSGIIIVYKNEGVLESIKQSFLMAIKYLDLISNYLFIVCALGIASLLFLTIPMIWLMPPFTIAGIIIYFRLFDEDPKDSNQVLEQSPLKNNTSPLNTESSDN